ncbi:DUF2971 domain-containing protein [Lonsdalea populi]|uniref:DUF2971 domain-containing protein n=1 Tax=Lonsdalea populi TaxID=1172565 RepID=UPI000A1D6C85|nr:DUF2971 domain-containing protein [Lonsdalea populi]OSM94086.1 hypothetical protein AU499_16525 [Lonsdalea populi]QPQ23127.1 DUF2971 domain-containing protein [Lonsdalea populi]RAT40139.1 hypothetical protein AU494_16600 [Lonsdalea populi]RAT40599.1 hypothetical protein AU495_16330 [Lonsdalea populi]RAT51268.1 hypothetical protein AU500_16440 [Lonsdalea populi]
MYLFKYYRPDFFFDKAIRYNELYFSAKSQLNDPNDLNIDYRFDNDLRFWDILLRSSCEYSYKNLTHILDFGDLKVHKVLNKIFKGKKIKGDLESLDALFDMHTNEILSILYEYLLPLEDTDTVIYENEPNPKQFLAKQCEIGIKERLYKKIIPAVFSVSFSSKALERMMWAHYAAGFSGCVVIYSTQEFTSQSNNIRMQLKDNLFSKDLISFPIKPITYSNQSKEISILDPTSNIIELILTKNKFWKYESEYRMFVPEGNTGIGGERDIKDSVNRNTGHVFHHETSAMQGIIFGPRMSKLKKEEIWQVIKSNVMNTNAKLFYFFDAELSQSGKINISNGQVAQMTQGYDLYKTDLTQPELIHVMNMLGIVN